MSAPGIGGWTVEHHTGRAGAFHGRHLPDPLVRSAWWFEVDGPAVVLGSTQRLAVVAEEAAAERGVEVARRRSGGGAVWLAPDEVTWVDVLLPADDHRWEHDVGRAGHWLGAAWAQVLVDLGVEDPRVHTGSLVRTPWSDLVCFAGLGPGEVTVGGRKVVGISQRRTRAGARFQCAVLHHWDPAPLLAVLALTERDRSAATAALAEVALGVPASSELVVEALLSHLATT